MKRNNKKRLIPLALALVLALLGVALAVPSINLTVQELGQGHATISSNIKNVKITWNLDSANPDYLDQTGEVDIDLSDSQNTIENGGKIYVKLYDGTTLVAVGETTLSSGTNTYTVDLQPASGYTEPIKLSDFDEVYVVYQGP